MSPRSIKALVFTGNAYEQDRLSLKKQPQLTMWNRTELNLLLALYGQRVAQGVWRDYAIDSKKNIAIFSVFKRSHDLPLYRIEKQPNLHRRQGIYALVNAHGHMLKRGHELHVLLTYFNKKQKPHLYWQTDIGK